MTPVVASVVLSYSCLKRDFKRKIAQTKFGVEFVVYVSIYYFNIKIYVFQFLQTKEIQVL